VARSFTVYEPEHPGLTPEAHDDNYKLDGLWDLIFCHDKLLTALKIEDALVVGHSFGGIVACELAAAYPRRVRRLALIDPIRAGTFLRSFRELNRANFRANQRILLADAVLPLAKTLERTGFEPLVPLVFAGARPAVSPYPPACSCQLLHAAGSAAASGRFQAER